MEKSWKMQGYQIIYGKSVVSQKWFRVNMFKFTNDVLRNGSMKTLIV